MTDDDTLKRALERIRDYRPSGPLSEWSEAAAFREVQEIAGDVLNPGQRAARINADETVRVANRRRVGAMQRGARYWLGDITGSGVWVTFLKGDAKGDGLAVVKVLELVGRQSGATYRIGEELSVYVGNLKTSPGAGHL